MSAPRAAIFLSILMPLLCWAGVIAVTDRPVFRGGSEGRRDRAAVALRDNVTPFKKWGSGMFPLRRLQRIYDQVWYFTQGRNDNRRAEILAALSEAARTHRTVDVFLLAHTNS